MYKILIVDDEVIVREGIEERIPWGELGFIFVGGYENGRDALEAVHLLKPDVVLSDICMPFMDGLELTRQITYQYPSTKVIILTGYDDFEYAQQAIKYKAYDFLLKPITSSELRKVLEKVKAEMDEETRKKEDLNRLKLQLNQSLPLLKERFLERLVTSYVKNEEIAEKLAYFNIRLIGSNYIALAIDIDDFGERNKYGPGTDYELLRFAVYNIVEEIMEKENRGIVFRNKDEKMIVILSGTHIGNLYELAQILAEETRQCVERYLKFTVTTGIGRSFDSLESINESCKSAISALDYRFLLGKNKVISIADMEGSSAVRADYHTEWEKKLIQGIKTGTGKEINETIENMIQSFKTAFTSMEKCYIHIQKITVSLMNTISELGGDAEEIFGQQVNPFTDIYKYKTIGEIELWLKNICKRATEYISEKRRDLNKIQVMKAEQYIKENYHSENISLNHVCKHVLMSISYFSLVFKNYTGETFVEYLTRIRVEKGMELLKYTNLKTYEVASKLGYSDSQYFSLIFKKNTGVSPTEYREKLSREHTP